MRVNYLILRVADMDRALTFYRDVLGLPVKANSGEFSFLDAGKIQLALNAASGTTPDESATEIVFEVNDVHEKFDVFRRRGVDFRVEPRKVMEAGGQALYACDFRDPDGHLLSITGWVKE